MLKIIIDGDASPVIDETVSLAKKYNLEVIIVKNYMHFIENDYADVISVDVSSDSADFKIANLADKGDIIISQDYGLAALAISQGAICVNQYGKLIDSNNIDLLLDRRHMNREIRKKHKVYSKFKKRTKDDNKKFKKALEKIIQSHLQ